MSRLRLASKLVSALAIVFFAGASTVACSKQAEAERCEIENGNLDCAEGLECVPRQLSDHICCPKVATTPECKGQVATPKTDTGVADTAPAVDIGVDAGADTTDAGSDTGLACIALDAPCTRTADCCAGYCDGTKCTLPGTPDTATGD